MKSFKINTPKFSPPSFSTPSFSTPKITTPSFTAPKFFESAPKITTESQLENIDLADENDRTYWEQYFAENPTVEKYLPPRPEGLRLLSFDGGGVRGLISLICLEHIMKTVAPGLKPCEYFDLIGGTSTGGLIAIMLGRLRMSVEECITTYKELAKNVFDLNILDRGINLIQSHLFSGGKLKEAIESIVEKHKSTTTDEMFDDPELRPEREICRSLVVALPGLAIARPAKLFRSYDNPHMQKRADRCKIWEAGRATSCAPIFFNEIVINGVIYTDGATGYNNPVQLIVREARSLWGPDHRISTILSIGTGTVKTDMARGNAFLAVLKALKSITTDCEKVHQEMLHDIDLRGIYHRYNPPLEKSIGLSEYDKMDQMETAAREYLKDEKLTLSRTNSSGAPTSP